MIISASRRTDIPAFYSNWFLNRIREGYIMVRNPIYPKKVYNISLSPKNVDAIIFWTKNPQKCLNILPELDDRGFFYYFLFTLNPYGKILEPNVPSIKEKIETFGILSKLLGKKRVIWRYDPIIFSDVTDKNYHIDQFYNLSESLKDYTEQCIVSFMVGYKKCVKNMNNINYENADFIKKSDLLNSLKQIADNFNINLTLCASENEIKGIKPSCCVDTDLINNLTGKKINYKKDSSQRIHCHCSNSIDIGSYNTCLHNCKYCYANYDLIKVQETVIFHNPLSPFLIGENYENEMVKEN